LGNGANILPIQEVVATYSSTGVFPVTHTVSTPNGCRSVITKTVGVYGASANLNLDKTTICLGQSINFNIKSDSSTVYAWSWDFADGTPSSTLLANPPPTATLNHVYTNYPLPNGSATVSLIYYSAQFACKYYAYYPIQIVKVNADFKRNNEIAVVDSVHCLGLTDNFSSLSPDPANSTFAWNFGNGNISNLQNPSYTYSVPGVYVVTLTVTDNINNCVGGSAKNMTVNPLPTASITARDTCQNSIFPLIGSAVANATSYTWTPASGVTNPNALVTTASASNSTSYTLTVTDVNGCVGSTVQNVYVQLPPKNIQWDTTIIIGQDVNIIGDAGSNLSPKTRPMPYSPSPMPNKLW
jgi:PKD repeat protein